MVAKGVGRSSWMAVPMGLNLHRSARPHHWDLVGPGRGDDLTRWIVDLTGSASALLATGPDRREHHMKFLAICTPRHDAPMDRFATVVPDEADALRQLKAEGILTEAWSPGGPGAVLIIEAPSPSEADEIVAGLPLGVAGLIDVEITPLHELGI